MKTCHTNSRAYYNALMNWILRTGYPEIPGRIEDHAAVKKLAKKFDTTPEGIASDVPEAERILWRQPIQSVSNLNLIDDFD